MFMIDFMFLVDIIIIFNTGIYDDYLRIIESRKLIAKKYLKGWFTIDLVAIVPFDLMMAA